MKLIINNKEKAQKFSHIFKCLKDVVEFVTLDFKKEGLYFQAMDCSQICLCELMLSLEWFDSYELDENEVITIPTSGIYHCLHCYNDGQSISMTYEYSMCFHRQYVFEYDPQDLPYINDLPHHCTHCAKHRQSTDNEPPFLTDRGSSPYPDIPNPLKRRQALHRLKKIIFHSYAINQHKRSSESNRYANLQHDHYHL